MIYTKIQIYKYTNIQKPMNSEEFTKIVETNQQYRAKIINEICSNLDTSNLTTEQCGYVIVDLNNIDDISVYSAENISPNAEQHFALDKKTTSKINTIHRKLDKFIAVYHTHINDLNGFSPTDIQSSKLTTIPYILINLKTGYCDYYNPNVIKDYVGREWSWSHTNCYSLVQDFYKQEFGINLGDYYLNSDAEWELDSWKGYLDYVEKEGFINVFNNLPIINDIKRGDLLLFKIGRTHTYNHAGIVYDVEKMLFIHHLTNKQSNIEFLDKAWLKRLGFIYRHRKICQN